MEKGEELAEGDQARMRERRFADKQSHPHQDSTSTALTKQTSKVKLPKLNKIRFLFKSTLSPLPPKIAVLRVRILALALRARAEMLSLGALLSTPALAGLPFKRGGLVTHQRSTFKNSKLHAFARSVDQRNCLSGKGLQIIESPPMSKQQLQQSEFQLVFGDYAASEQQHSFKLFLTIFQKTTVSQYRVEFDESRSDTQTVVVKSKNGAEDIGRISLSVRGELACRAAKHKRRDLSRAKERDRGQATDLND